MKKALFSWSTGKDSSIALYEVLKSGDYEISALLTTVTDGYERVSMHGVRTSLLQKQAEYVNLPLEVIRIPKECSNARYEKVMLDVLNKYHDEDVQTVIFGDLFLEDIREYRERQLARIGMNASFPIWNFDTRELSGKIIDSGFKSIVVCVDGNCLGEEFAGREYNSDFISKLPDKVDPCGENGEFHTFTYGGPVFSNEIVVKTGDTELRDNRFYYCDLLPA